MTMRLPSMILLAALALSGCGKQDLPRRRQPGSGARCRAGTGSGAGPEARGRGRQRDRQVDLQQGLRDATPPAWARPSPATRPTGASARRRATETLYKHRARRLHRQEGHDARQGGNTSLGDADVKAAVEYMLSR